MLSEGLPEKVDIAKPLEWILGKVDIAKMWTLANLDSVEGNLNFRKSGHCQVDTRKLGFCRREKFVDHKRTRETAFCVKTL